MGSEGVLCCVSVHLILREGKGEREGRREGKKDIYVPRKARQFVRPSSHSRRIRRGSRKRPC